jgi:hypothetical protein
MSEESTKTPQSIGEVTGTIISRMNGHEIVRTEDGDEIAVPLKKETPPPIPLPAGVDTPQLDGEGENKPSESVPDVVREGGDQLSRLFEANKQLGLRVDGLVQEIIALKADRERWQNRAQAAEADVRSLTSHKPQFRIVQNADEKTLAKMAATGWTVEHMQAIPKAHGDALLFVVFRREPENDSPPEPVKREAKETPPTPPADEPMPERQALVMPEASVDTMPDESPMPERQTLVGVNGAPLDDLGLMMGWTNRRRHLTRDDFAGIFTRAQALLADSDIDYRSPLRGCITD